MKLAADRLCMASHCRSLHKALCHKIMWAFYRQTKWPHINKESLTNQSCEINSLCLLIWKMKSDKEWNRVCVCFCVYCIYTETWEDIHMYVHANAHACIVLHTFINRTPHTLSSLALIHTTSTFFKKYIYTVNGWQNTLHRCLNSFKC